MQAAHIMRNRQKQEKMITKLKKRNYENLHKTRNKDTKSCGGTASGKRVER